MQRLERDDEFRRRLASAIVALMGALMVALVLDSFFQPALAPPKIQSSIRIPKPVDPVF
ncbi:MAG: hypothetical protein LBT62_06835 [Deltaproteobacteria bacterium]|nr:hypothetical protein [Deltaproteobacteria bacterium]